ncbi:MAG: hypothetical protein ACREMG_12450 [Gemmatimonadales bacterium]
MNDERTTLHIESFEDLIARVTQFDSFTIDGRVYSAPFLIGQLTIDTKDLVSEQSLCPAQVLYWGLMAAQARRGKARVEAAYRQWRDRTFLEIKNKPLAKEDAKADKFPSDTVAEKMYRTAPDYGDWQKRQDDAQWAAENAEAIYEAFKCKRAMIESQQKTLHDQAGGPYQLTEESRRTIPRTPQMTAAQQPTGEAE